MRNTDYIHFSLKYLTGSVTSLDQLESGWRFLHRTVFFCECIVSCSHFFHRSESGSLALFLESTSLARDSHIGVNPSLIFFDSSHRLARLASWTLSKMDPASRYQVVSGSWSKHRLIARPATRHRHQALAKKINAYCLYWLFKMRYVGQTKSRKKSKLSQVLCFSPKLVLLWYPAFD